MKKIITAKATFVVLLAFQLPSLGWTFCPAVPVPIHKTLLPYATLSPIKSPLLLSPSFCTRSSNTQTQSQFSNASQFRRGKNNELRNAAGSSEVQKSEDNDGKGSSTSVGALTSTTLLVLLDILFRKLFKYLNISFPSSLGGCGAIFATLILTNLSGRKLGDKLYGYLSPGAATLAKWLPVFFVPSLVILPLAPSLGSTMELLKVAVVILGGFLFTLFTTAWSVSALRLFSRDKEEAASTPLAEDPKDSKVSSTTSTSSQGPSSPSPPPPFSFETFDSLAFLATLSGIAAAIFTSIKSSSYMVASRFTTAYMLFTTLASFVFGARLPSNFKKVVHPLVTCTGLTWVGIKLMSLLTGQTFLTVLNGYKVGNMCPFHCGGGDILLFMLGPAVLSLACQMYDKKKLMKENIAEVGTAISVSSIGGLFGTAYLVKLLDIGNPILRLSLISRNITSPLAMAIAGILGADISLAVSMVVISGLIGANFGASILNAVGIKNPVARGMGIGAAAHGLGTAAFTEEKDAFPFAAISMALTASMCTVLVSIPKIKSAVLKLALGM